MGNRIKASNTAARIVFILAFAASLATFWYTRSGSGWTDLLLNCVFDAAAAVFLLAYFAGSARPAARLVSALDEFSNTIRNHAAASDPKTLWAELSKEKPFPAGTPLAERYGAFVKETRREQRINPATADCDIADYINEDLLYSVMRKHFCDQISGVMTALGILFTFIGLVYGLRSFNATTVELMQESTQLLMAGIKVAFLTSIFGLIYSLIFTLFYRRLLRNATQALYDFQDCYTECVRPNNAHAAENTLIRLQSEQNEMLEKFASNVGSAVSESLSASIRPVVEKLDRTLQGYVTVAIEDQRAGLEKVVEYFFGSIDRAMGGVSAQLRAQTEELTVWQKTMVAGIQKLLDSVGGTQADLEKSRKYTQLIIERVEAFTANAETLVDRQLESLHQIEGFMNDYQALHKAEKAYILDMAAAAKSAETSSEKNLAAAEAVTHMADAYTDELERKMADVLTKLCSQVAVMGEDARSDAETTHRQLESAGDRLVEAADSLRGVSDRSSSDMTAAAVKLSESLNGSFDRFDQQLASLGGALNTLRASSDELGRSLKGLPEAAGSFDADLGKAGKTLKTELNALLGALTDTRKALDKFAADAARKVNR